jgi:hypothetical protein
MLDRWFRYSMTVAAPGGLISVCSLGLLVATHYRGFGYGLAVGVTMVICGMGVAMAALLVDMWKA